MRDLSGFNAMPDLAERVRELAKRVPYSIKLIWDMILMGMNDDEIEAICRGGAATDMPECVADPAMRPADMYDMASAAWFGAKGRSLKERINEYNRYADELVAKVLKTERKNN
jgi:hypothetical protein